MPGMFLFSSWSSINPPSPIYLTWQHDCMLAVDPTCCQNASPNSQASSFQDLSQPAKPCLYFHLRPAHRKSKFYVLNIAATTSLHTALACILHIVWVPCRWGGLCSQPLLDRLFSATSCCLGILVSVFSSLSFYRFVLSYCQNLSSIYQLYFHAFFKSHYRRDLFRTRAQLFHFSVNFLHFHRLSPIYLLP